MAGAWDEQELQILNEARMEIGMAPVANEFAAWDPFVRAGQRYWTKAKRSAKAKKQLRHWKTKRWIGSRINFDFPEFDDGSVRAQLGGDREGAPRYAKSKRVSGNPAKRAQAEREKTVRPKITNEKLKKRYENIKFLKEDEIRQALAGSKIPAQEIDDIAKNYLVITRDGIHMTVIPTELSNAAKQQKLGEEGVKEWDEQLKKFRSIEQQFIAAGLTPSEEVRNKIMVAELKKLEAQKKITEAQQRMKRAKKQALTTEWDPPGSNNYYLAIASDALNEIEKATALGVPQWRLTDENGNRRPFVVNLEPAMFEGKPRLSGFTIAGSDMMHVNPKNFTVSPKGRGFMEEAKFENLAIYAINHELGHMVDESEHAESPWESATRYDLMEVAKLGGETGQYAESAIYELYAEAWALRQYQLATGKPYTPLTQAMSDAFGWDLPQRPAQSPASLDPNADYVPPLSPMEHTLYFLATEAQGKLLVHNPAGANMVDEAIKAMEEGDYQALRVFLHFLYSDPAMAKLLLP